MNIHRSLKPPEKRSFFLFGPRGTGKSHFLRSYYRDAKTIDLLDEKTLMDFSAHPERLEAVVSAMANGEVLVIEEVQKAPNLLSKIHQLIEEPRFPNVYFALTGSSVRKLQREGVDLLAGRAVLKTLHPFTAGELGENFNLEKHLALGMLPLVWSSPNPQATLESYVALYLKEEVKAERLVKNLATFTRFLEAMTFSHGEVLNLSNVARESGVKRSTCDGHLEVLEDLLLGYRIPIFKKRNRKQTVDSDKFYFFDSGVYQSLKPSGPLDDPGATKGPAFEGFIEQHLRASISYRNCGEEMFYWRTKAGNEVDFVVYGPDRFDAVEVKNSTNIRPKDLSGLKSFLADYPEAQAKLVYRGNHRQKIGNITCIPAEDFLRNL